ncbi:MAG: DUF1080 domain-containing protein [Ferruginibacter sp.]
MKKVLYFLIVTLVFFVNTSFSQTTTKIDLHAAVKGDGIKVFNRDMKLINETAHPGISLSRDFGEGIAWIKGVDFSNGILEFDVRGENLKQHSFVGIAFHGKDDSTFDAVYLRPFQFKMKDETFKNRMIQFISLPDFTWQVLREKSPGKYEHSIDPAPDPDAWVKMRIVVKNGSISTYINGNKEPSLVVEKLTHNNSGMIGFYVADTSGGDFANLTITKTD